MRIHNLSNEVKVWCGQEIQAQGTYDLNPSEVQRWAWDESFLIDVALRNACVEDNSLMYLTLPLVEMLLRGEEARDQEGASLVRTKMAQAGWTYHRRAFQFEVGKLGSLVNMMVDGTSFGDATVDFFNAQGQSLTTQEAIDSECVITSLAWEPTHDYEIVGGSVRQLARPMSPIRVFVTAVPDVPEIYGGTKRLIACENLEFIDPADAVFIDGRTPKRLNYSATNHTNKIRICLRHDIGVKHEVQFAVEVFRP